MSRPNYSSPITNPYAKMRESAYSGLGNQYGNVQMPNPYSLDRPRGFSSPVFPRPMQLSQPQYNPPMGGMYGGGKGGGNMYGMGGYRPAAPYMPGR